ncbi:GntR family transcriptional regulator [uncultured Enterovirga sp.]|uniref:GntR family transcriptional regulator n=1 Tax=uncultured Enterovirga sp. TaxID=2026352 RepID=UPI0035CA7A45
MTTTDQSMRVAPVAAPIRSQVVETLRTAITSGRFAPGQRLVEKDLCDLLGVSRPSVREALRELESEGLIRTIPNRGPLVSMLSAEDAASIYQVRGVLEALAAKLFAEKATPEQVAALSDSVDRLAAAYGSGEVEQILVAKKAFYDILLDGSQNVIIPSMLRTMNARITQLRRVSLSSPKRLPGSIREIRAVLKAIKARDPEAAFQASLRHIAEASKVAMTKLKD